MTADPLADFSAPVAEWFREVFAEPTVVQRDAWRAISAGQNTLVVAPTGSGKTLAAFLWSLSELSRGFLQLAEGDAMSGEATTDGDVVNSAAATVATGAAGARGRKSTTGTRVLYISPLKALGVDVDRNLSVPLVGINRVAERLGEPVAPIRVGVRSGDTPSSERSRMLRTPPEILITTPESLYLMLTSKAAGTLKDVDTVIVDEIHAVAGTKRGAHLALSLERLDMLVGRPVQRIGLSATVNPVDTVASFLGGSRPVTVVHPQITKLWDVQVRSVVPDFQDPPPFEEPAATTDDTATADTADAHPVAEHSVDEALLGPSLIGEGLGGSTGAGSGAPVASGVDKESALPQQKSVWPHVQQAIYEQIMDNRSTLVFVNSRRSAERLTGALNEAYAREHAPESLASETRRDPAQMMAQSAKVTGAPAIIARAHHGSVSKDERADIEAALKSGDLRCVVATSSLELGIDMGLVDYVIQVGAPPSVAAAVQRCGRAGHSVGAVSRATVYPLHKQDAEVSAVVVDRMLRGELEPIAPVTNALDVLAQQTVAAAVQQEVSGGAPLQVEAWWEVVRRAFNYAALPREAFDGAVELVAGRYVSTDFADLKPRVTYDLGTGEIMPRPGAQRVAVTNGGTIPDRGMFGVFLAQGEGSRSGDNADGATQTSATPSGPSQRGGRRVGELDEEMVYESRVGDVFTLGASSWRIVDITRDQVHVLPASGHTGRLPFWVGDAEGRPVQLGQAIGRARRAWGRGGTEDLSARDFLDEHTVRNLQSFYDQQREDTGALPDERTLMVESFRDEVGDWRVIIHSPYGRGVNAPWALSLAAHIQRESGFDAMPVAGDDGLVLRLPYTEDAPGTRLIEQMMGGHAAGTAGGAEVAEAVIADVMESVGSSALFAGRFRECAARALLLPRRNPGQRQPLWQQRQRAAQLLDIAREHPDFPIMLETMRECVHDVYRLKQLKSLVTRLSQGSGVDGARIAEVTTERPSAFAEALLFTYTGAFMYEGDSAERAAALSVDPALLAKVLGTHGDGLSLDPAVVEQVVDSAQWLADGRRARSEEQLVDMLRMLGPLPTAEIDARQEAVASSQLEGLLESLSPRRLMRVSFGQPPVARWAVVEDAQLLRDGLGVPVPPGVSASTQVVTDALDQLLLRWAHHRGPVTAADAAAEFGLGVATAVSLLARWVSQRRLQSGTFVEQESGQAVQYVDATMLRRFRSATLAKARGALRPVSVRSYASVLGRWHGLGMGESDDLPGVLEQLAGVPLPASAWETVVLPARIPSYKPGQMDELLQTGEFVAVGAGQAGRSDAWVQILPVDLAGYLLLGERSPEDSGQPDHPEPSFQGESAQGEAFPTACRVLDHLRFSGGAFLASELARQTGIAAEAVDAALWELFDAGEVYPDSFAPLRARMSGSIPTGSATSGPTAGAGGNNFFASGATAHRAPRRGRGRGASRRAMIHRAGAARRAAMNVHSSVPGRWSAVSSLRDAALQASVADSGRAAFDADQAALMGQAWIDRHAVVTRGAVLADQTRSGVNAGGFAAAYQILSAWEDSGEVTRGYIVEGLGGAQFAPLEVLNQLRRTEEEQDTAGASQNDQQTYLLAAVDPANPYGAGAAWPPVPEGAAQPTRGAGALVIIGDGEALAFLTRGGRNVTLFGSSGDSGSDDAAATATGGAPSAATIRRVVQTMRSAIAAEHLAPVIVEKINGRSVLESATGDWIAAGARLVPKGLRINA